MAMPRTRINPPVAVKPHYGLLDIATIHTTTDTHWQTGVEYDTPNCTTAQTWGPICTGTGTAPHTIQRHITTTVTGTLTGDTYTTTITAQIDGGADRQLRATVTPTTINLTTNNEPTQLTESNEPLTGTLTITDILTGTTGNYPIEQNPDDGTITPNEFTIAVNDTDTEGECPVDTITYTYEPADGSVSVVVSSDIEGPHTIDITVNNQTVTVSYTQVSEPVVFTDIPPGLYEIAARNQNTSSYTSGSMYAGVDGGVAVLLLSSCASKEPQPPWVTVSEDPFTVYASVACSSVGLSVEESLRAAAESLELSRGREIEREYWSRLVGGSREVVSGGVGVVRAVAELEAYVASRYVGLGVIHTSPFGVGFLAGAGLLDASAVGGERLRTWRGTPVVVGSGYLRGDLGGSVGGSDFWLVVSGDVSVWLGEVFVRDSFDRLSNVVSAVAEQTVVVIDDCLVPGRVRVVPDVLLVVLVA